MKRKRLSESRQSYQIKRARKGLKSQRGQPEYYDELKKIFSFSLTKTARNGINKLSKEQGISASEFIEQIGRSKFRIVLAKQEQSPE